jgi:hypothetical protein
MTRASMMSASKYERYISGRGIMDGRVKPGHDKGEPVAMDGRVKPGHDIGEAVAAFFFAFSGLSGLQRT